jgi:hypothetical protein
MEKFTLHNKLKDLIGNRSVQAAVFHTFNFDPEFFENYVMPLLVHGVDFGSEAIRNRILWRRLEKDGKIPPITVLCDFYAKDNTKAPGLGYDIHCVKMQVPKGNIANFHPKNIFLLLDDKTLLWVSGSGNITPSGWCENIECFNFREFKDWKRNPNTARQNELQTLIRKAAGGRDLSEAEKSIVNTLSYLDEVSDMYSSYEQSFHDFIQQIILPEDEIKRIDIVSPYFSHEPTLVNKLREMGIEEINCLIPTRRDNEVMLEEAIFDAYGAAGIQWSLWQNKALNKEVRNLHAKIYRFYGQKHTYTFTGSVNFTQAAWKGVASAGNAECGILEKEKTGSNTLLQPQSDIDKTKLNFQKVTSEENPEENPLVGRSAPEIDFVIDWQERKLSYLAHNLQRKAWKFADILESTAIKERDQKLYLNDDNIKLLAKNTLIKIVEHTTGKAEEYAYYPKQLGIANKPLGFALRGVDILQFWLLLEKPDYEVTQYLERKAQELTDESGIVNENRLNSGSILNEMAMHYAAISKLEKHLLESKGNKKEHAQKLIYFLTSENIDTVPFYLQALKKQVEQGSLLKSLYWMILQVSIIMIDKAYGWFKHNSSEHERFAGSIQHLERIKKAYVKEAKEISSQIYGLTADKEKWIIKHLRKNHE